MLPDLGVAPIQHPLIEITAEGRKRLRFTVSIANVGRAPLEIEGRRTKRGAQWQIWQRIWRSDGTSYLVPKPAIRMVFVGTAEHGHWHARGIAHYELRRLDDLRKVRARAKRGFCFYDSSAYKLSLPGAPRKGAYLRGGCGVRRALLIDAGISVGWKDDYYWRIPGQAMDITTLPTGRYRLLVRVDPENWLQESNERNNVTWVDLAIGEQLVRVLRRSPRL